MREGYYNTINRFVCCLQSPIRSLGRLPLGLGSLNKICSSPPLGFVPLSLSSLPFLVCWASVCITKRKKAES